ncbi:MAG TPA: urease accessory protein UreD, partial [Pseudolysinimonas sp.]|nr:urease accessory protein UreD [Pseudolysinimonas sp.]
SSWRLAARIDEAGRLIWRGLPFVVASGARARRVTEISLAPGAAVLMRETVVLGRHGEKGGDVRSDTRIELEDHPVLLERLEVDAAIPQIGVLGTNRVIDSVIAVGYRPPSAAGALILETPGAIARHLSRDAHNSGLDEVWESWHAALTH